MEHFLCESLEKSKIKQQKGSRGIMKRWSRRKMRKRRSSKKVTRRRRRSRKVHKRSKRRNESAKK